MLGDFHDDLCWRGFIKSDWRISARFIHEWDFKTPPVASSNYNFVVRQICPDKCFSTRHALPRSFTRFLRLAKISPSAARNASFVLTALLRQLLTVLFHGVANHVANFAASDVASRDYHLVANPVLTVLLTTLRTLLLRMLPRVVTTLLLTVLPRRC